MSAPGQAAIQSFTVNGVDASDMVQELQLIESIYTQCVTVIATIFDAGGFQEKAKLKDKLAKVSLKVLDSNQSPIELNLRVAQVFDRSRTAKGGEMIKIRCHPHEMLKNPEKKITKTYDDQKVSEIERKVFDEYIKGSDTKKKDVDIEETEGKSKYYSTNKTPLQVMGWANKNGKSAKKPGQRLFYQTLQDGYKIKSIESLIEDSSSATTIERKTVNLGENQDMSNSVKSWYVNQDGDATNDLNGASGTRTVYIDPRTGRRKEVERKGQNGEVSEEKYVYRYFLDSESKFQRARAGEDVGKNNEEGAKNETSRSKGHKLDNRVITATVPFLTKYKVGEKTTFNVAATGDTKEKDSRSGTYLITGHKVRIYLDKQNGMPAIKGESILELKSVVDADKEA